MSQNPPLTNITDFSTKSVEQTENIIKENEETKSDLMTASLVGIGGLIATAGPMVLMSHELGLNHPSGSGTYLAVGVVAAGALAATGLYRASKHALQEYRARQALEEKTGSSEIESDHNRHGIAAGVVRDVGYIAMGAAVGGALATVTASWSTVFLPLLVGTVAAGFLTKKSLDLYEKMTADHQEEITTDSSMVAPLTTSGLKGRIAHMREQQANDGPAPETTPALKM